MRGEPQRLKQALRTLLPGASAASARKLGGGISNASYTVAHAGKRYVLRFRLDSPGARLTLGEELALLRPLAAAGITPQALGIDEPTQALLTRFVADAVQWTTAAARDGANIARIADVLRRLHAVPAKTRLFDPVRYAEQYVEAAKRRLDERGRRLAAELRERAADFGARYRASAVCHNDLVAANVLDDRGALLLVDFEYAALASPVLDLASLAAMNEYDRAGQRELLCAYFMTAAAPVAADEFAKVVRLVRLLAFFWAMAAEGEDGELSPYLRIGAAEIE